MKKAQNDFPPLRSVRDMEQYFFPDHLEGDQLDLPEVMEYGEKAGQHFQMLETAAGIEAFSPSNESVRFYRRALSVARRLNSHSNEFARFVAARLCGLVINRALSLPPALLNPAARQARGDLVREGREVFGLFRDSMQQDFPDAPDNEAQTTDRLTTLTNADYYAAIELWSFPEQRAWLLAHFEQDCLQLAKHSPNDAVDLLAACALMSDHSSQAMRYLAQFYLRLLSAGLDRLGSSADLSLALPEDNLLGKLARRVMTRHAQANATSFQRHDIREHFADTMWWMMQHENGYRIYDLLTSALAGSEPERRPILSYAMQKTDFRH